jgi:hypothetical protein
MEDYELEPDKIISWATQYASYEELEYTAKQLYGVYTVWRKKEFPELEKKAKKHKQQFRKGGKRGKA